MSMPGRLLALLCALLCLGAVGCGDDDDGGTTPIVSPNRVTVESVTAAPGDQIAIEVSYHCETAILGMEIPLEISSAACTINSVSFEGGRFEDYFLTTAVINQQTRVIDIILADVADAIENGDHLVATLHLTIDAGATAQSIEIDDTSWIEGNLLHSLSCIRPDQSVFKPSFTKGTITVQVPEG